MPTAPTGRATRAHLKTSLATRRLRDQGLKHGPRPSAIVSNFPQPAVLRLLPTRETLARQHARWPRRISLRDGAQRDRACVATGGLHTFVRTQQRVVERAHSNVARKTKGWLEHKIRHAVGTREAYSQFRRHAQSPECWTRNFVSSGIILRPPAGAGGKISQRRAGTRSGGNKTTLGGLRGRCNEIVFRASTLRAGKNLEPVRTPKRRNKHRQLHFIATVGRQHLSAYSGDEMELTVLIPPFGRPHGLKVFTCPKCGRSEDYLVTSPSQAA